MALKHMLASKADVEALPEAVRALYVEKDGKFQLDVEGVAPATEVSELKTKLAEFRDNNRTMHGELETLRPLVKKYEGIDPDEYHTLKTEVATLKGKGITKPEDLDSVVKKAVEAATKPLADKLAAEERARQEAQNKVRANRFKELVIAEATKAGVAQKSVRHVLREAEQLFELKDDDTIAPRAGVKHPTEPHKDLTPTDWLQQLAKTDDNLFEASIGGGAGGGDKRNNPKAKTLINPTPEEMGQHIDALAKGEMVVVRN